MKGKMTLTLISITVLALLPVQGVRAQCECLLVPDVSVVARGGTLGFDITVTNNTDEVQVFGFATYATKPGGGKYPLSGYLIGPVRVSLDPYGSRSAHRSLPISSDTPLGTYTYHGIVGTPGVGLYHQCQFYFQVTDNPYNCLACHSGHHSIQHGCSGCHSGNSLHTLHYGVIQCTDCHSFY
jgi:hypothetical protein